MLDSYHEEVRRKRNAYAIFWGVVFLFAVLLYMFFQGYYFSVQVGFERLIHGGSSQVTTSTGANDAVLKSFGIISMRVDPTPATMTVNGLPYQNGDKRIYDYGAYTMDIQNPGYLPIAIKIELSRLNPFYLNTVRLLEVPRETRFPETLRSIETLNGFAIAETFSGSFLYITAPYSGSGTPLGTSASGGILSSSLKNLGEGYFTGSGKIWSLDTTGKLIPTTLFSQESTKNTLCPEVKMIRGDMYCSKTGVFLTGKYKDLKEKIIEANPEFIRTESSIIRLGGTFFNSSTPLTNSVSFSGASSLINYKDRLLVLNSWRMFDLEKGLTEVQIPAFERVTATEKFGDEILTIGMKEGRSWLMLEDGKNEALRVDLRDRDMSHTKLSQHSGAYFITTKKEVLVYYKGATELLTLASGDILGMFDTTIFYNKDGVTYKMTLEGVE